MSVKRVNPPSLPFSDIIRTRSPLSFSSTGTLVPHLNANKSEKGINWQLVLLQTRMIKCGKYPDKPDKLFTLQNIANLQGIGITVDFGFKIYKDLTKWTPFQLGFKCYISLFTDVVLFFFSLFSKNLLHSLLPPYAGGQWIPRGFYLLIYFFIMRARRTSKRK